MSILSCRSRRKVYKFWSEFFLFFFLQIFFFVLSNISSISNFFSTWGRVSNFFSCIRQIFLLLEKFFQISESLLKRKLCYQDLLCFVLKKYRSFPSWNLYTNRRNYLYHKIVHLLGPAAFGLPIIFFRLNLWYVNFTLSLITWYGKRDLDYCD